MKLNKLSVWILSSLMAFSTVGNAAPVKKQTASKPTATKQTTVKKTTAKKTTTPKKAKQATAKKSTAKQSAANHSKTYYGVKGHKLQPTTISTKTYSYREKGKTHQTISKEASRNYSQVGVASYYGGMFNGRKTANGEIFNENLYTAAHKTLALGSYALVTNLRNNRKIIVKINDRGPFSKNRIIDLSKGAAREIGMIQSGVAQVKVEAIQVDSQGYISGKGAESLYKLAKKEGLPLKLKQGSKVLAFKADESGKKAKTAQEKTPKTAEKNVMKGAKVVVVTKTLKDAKSIAVKVKQKAVVEQYNGFYRVIISVKDQAEGNKVQKQVKQLAKPQSIQYLAN